MRYYGPVYTSDIVEITEYTTTTYRSPTPGVRIVFFRNKEGKKMVTTDDNVYIKVCDANCLGSSARCTLAKGHAGWHQEWEIEDGQLQLQIEWKYTRKEEIAKIKEDGYWQSIDQWNPGH